ncbi:polysaccharide biosynthesis tyrosine autokinase [Streptomyces sp. RKAG293]|uniref:polysaccharide biosynthesis tyrosine autokinase n=1 Tax=Streptomyces sp. RKAG293 TaxID=2893403 RepID=UPI002033B6B3|nr:polysaccharide biosynthesis tyrosine autokinase [Streptomyces sp. RKAG293]MCM2419054.1 lipopolysaccharide biosynthesis protein [Streptomyces sp. RKAG293]
MIEQHDEPDLLRDQFRQLIRYRVLIVAGVVIGLLGGAVLALSGADKYVATSEITVRAATVNPFATGATPDKILNMGSERQTAASGVVAERAAKALGQPEAATELLANLQVTNPPQTTALDFAYTGRSPREAAARANALTQAYLDNRQQQTASSITIMVNGYKTQLDPLVKQSEALRKQIEKQKDPSSVATNTNAQTNLLGRISELNGNISELKALDTTSGNVIRTAVPPTSAAGLGLPMALGLGLAVGIAIGLLAAWVRLVFDPAARSDSDVARALRAPVLGTLPRVRDGREPAPLLALDNTESRLAEAYRSVAFRLAYDQRFADRRRLLVVAPRGSSETATAVSVNLAASFAETGMEVLLIEADLRTPTLADRLRSGDGTRPAWARTPSVGDGGWPAGHQISIDAGESGSFDLVPGRRVRNVARALTSVPATRLISEADAPKSAVIVHAPAVLAYADALALVDRVDGVLVVCDPREVHRADLERVRELISGAGGTVLGAVLHSSGSTGFTLPWRRNADSKAPLPVASAEDAGSAPVSPAADLLEAVLPEPERSPVS